MRRRILDEAPSPTARPAPLVIPHDIGNEAAVIAAAAQLSIEPLRALVRRVRVDHFIAREHQEAWQTISEIARQGLSCTSDVMEKIGGISVSAYVDELIDARAPGSHNLDWHLEHLFWDAARVTAARGPVPAFLEHLRDPKAEPDKVRSLARQVAASFEGYQDRRHLLDPARLVREQMSDVESRVAGRACYPYGIEGLDFYERSGDTHRRRMVPGAAPGKVTVLTGTSGSGKSTCVARMALGLAGWNYGTQSFQGGRKILYGAWEMTGGMTLELIACLTLGWSRTELMDPLGAPPDAPVRTHVGRIQLEERMHELAKRIRFLGNPFRRTTGEKASNDRNLDIIQGYIADSGADVFIADLWKRCLRGASPEEEEDALFRQQAMAEETGVHAILVQQQRLKDVEQREDKRPTREGIKGSGAWVEIADTIIGIHRPALWKRISDARIEACILKQRYGKWPLAVEFDWDADKGTIEGGRSIEYERPGERSEFDEGLLASSNRGKPQFRRRRAA